MPNFVLTMTRQRLIDHDCTFPCEQVHDLNWVFCTVNSIDLILPLPQPTQLHWRTYTTSLALTALWLGNNERHKNCFSWLWLFLVKIFQRCDLTTKYILSSYYKLWPFYDNGAHWLLYLWLNDVPFQLNDTLSVPTNTHDTGCQNMWPLLDGPKQTKLLPLEQLF